MIKKLVFVILLILIIGIALVYKSSAVEFTWNDDGLNIIIDATMSQLMINYFGNVPGVTSIEIDEEGKTIILITEELANGIGFNAIKDYAEDLEWKLKDNKANVVMYPDNFPAPVCMRNVIQNASGLFPSNVSGLYLVNNQPFIVDNDPRCL